MKDKLPLILLPFIIVVAFNITIGVAATFALPLEGHVEEGGVAHGEVVRLQRLDIRPRGCANYSHDQQNTPAFQHTAELISSLREERGGEGGRRLAQADRPRRGARARALADESLVARAFDETKRARTSAQSHAATHAAKQQPPGEPRLSSPPLPMPAAANL